MIIKKYEEFYKVNDLKVCFNEDEIPMINGIDCMCDNPKDCGYSCNNGIPCKIFKPNDRFIKWKEIGIDSRLIDWDKDYIKERVPSILDLKIQELEARIIELESKEVI